MTDKPPKPERYSLAITAICLCFFLLGLGWGIAFTLLALL